MRRRVVSETEGEEEASTISKVTYDGDDKFSDEEKHVNDGDGENRTTRQQ